MSIVFILFAFYKGAHRPHICRRKKTRRQWNGMGSIPSTLTISTYTKQKYFKETKVLTPGVFLIFHSNEEKKNEDEKNNANPICCIVIKDYEQNCKLIISSRISRI